MTDHLTFEQTCDLADGVLAHEEQIAAREHVRVCADCSARFGALTDLTSNAAALPHEIAPPIDLWRDIQREIGRAAPMGKRRAVGLWRTPQFAAAAVVIALVSSALTATVIERMVPATMASTALVTDAAPALPASLASRERRFERSAAQLQITLAERRDSLAPSTIATVERSLRVADSAIAEARMALAHDPSNAALVKLYASNYERKIDLLKRATELAPRT